MTGVNQYPMPGSDDVRTADYLSEQLTPFIDKIVDTTIGRFQVVRDDPRTNHSFMSICRDELETQLRRVLKHNFDHRIRTSSDADGGAELIEHDTGSNEADVAKLRNQLNTIRASELYLRSVAIDMMKDVRDRGAEVATLKGVVERRDALLKEQRVAYIKELLHLREIIRQYRSGGSSDLADAMFHAWDQDLAAQQQQEEQNKRIEQAVEEVRVKYEAEKDQLKETQAKAVEDFRRQIAYYQLQLSARQEKSQSANVEIQTEDVAVKEVVASSDFECQTDLLPQALPDLQVTVPTALVASTETQPTQPSPPKVAAPVHSEPVPLVRLAADKPIPVPIHTLGSQLTLASDSDRGSPTPSKGDPATSPTQLHPTAEGKKPRAKRRGSASPSISSVGGGMEDSIVSLGGSHRDSKLAEIPHAAERKGHADDAGVPGVKVKSSHSAEVDPPKAKAKSGSMEAATRRLSTSQRGFDGGMAAALSAQERLRQAVEMENLSLKDDLTNLRTQLQQLRKRVAEKEAECMQLRTTAGNPEEARLRQEESVAVRKLNTTLAEKDKLLEQKTAELLKLENEMGRWFANYRKSQPMDQAPINFEVLRMLSNAVSQAEEAESRYREQSWKIIMYGLHRRTVLEGQSQDCERARLDHNFPLLKKEEERLDKINAQTQAVTFRLRNTKHHLKAEANRLWDSVLYYARCLSNGDVVSSPPPYYSGISAPVSPSAQRQEVEVVPITSLHHGQALSPSRGPAQIRPVAEGQLRPQSAPTKPIGAASTQAAVIREKLRSTRSINSVESDVPTRFVSMNQQRPDSIMRRGKSRPTVMQLRDAKEQRDVLVRLMRQDQLSLADDRAAQAAAIFGMKATGGQSLVKEEVASGMYKFRIYGKNEVLPKAN